MMGDKSKTDKLAGELSKRLMDEGKIIAAGWASFCHLCMPADALQIQVDEMRKAFFAGAQHLWGSLMTGLDPDAEPTVMDERRMELIDAELRDFGARLMAEIESKGRA